MKKLQIEVDVRLPSGAQVLLTKEQNERVVNLVSDLVTKGIEAETTEAPVKKKPKRMKSYHVWSNAEDNELVNIFRQNVGVPVAQVSRLAAKRMGLLEGAVTSRYYKLREDGRMKFYETGGLERSSFSVPVTSS
jgi:predicted oxidoreductase (fatty acid repression mutant protein)